MCTVQCSGGGNLGVVDAPVRDDHDVHPTRGRDAVDRGW
jgi:hypothetical protein